jgi:N-acetylmuramoyl-L-alanine amidase
MILALIVKMIACSGILLGYYWVFLRNKRFHHYNRFYLLGATALSIILPFIKIPIFIEPNSEGKLVYRSIEVISVNNWGHEFVQDSGSMEEYSWLNLQDLFVIIYFAIVIILFFLFLRSLIYIRNLSKRYPVEHIHTLKFYNTTEPGTPFSFFKSIFWNKRLDFKSQEGQQIFRHELFHVRQKHSADIVFVESIGVLLWMNPFFHLIKKEIKAIHEFLADQHAVSHNNQHDYAELLLMQSITEKKSSLSTYFFQNHIKRRIAMITQMKSNKYNYWTRLMVLPMSLLLFCAIALYAHNPAPNSFKKENVFNRSEKLSEEITVVVDAGHGGQDAGARNVEGILEKDLTLAIARKIREHAPAYKVKVVMTRNEDVYPTLKQRTEMATTVKADMIVSVHIATTDNPAGAEPNSGFEVFVTNRNTNTIERSKVLGQSIAAQLKDLYAVGPIKQRKEKGIWILDAATCPAVLLECGYLSYPQDVAFISDPSNQEKIAKGILQGIVSYTVSQESTALIDSIPTKKNENDTLKPGTDSTGIRTELKPLESKILKKPLPELEKQHQLLVEKQRQLEISQRKIANARIEQKNKLQRIQNQKQEQLQLMHEKMERSRINHKQKLERIHMQKRKELELAHSKIQRANQPEMKSPQKLQMQKQKEVMLQQSRIQKKQLAQLHAQQKLHLQKQQEIQLMYQKIANERIAELNKLEQNILEKKHQLELYKKKIAEPGNPKIQKKELNRPSKPKSQKQARKRLEPGLPEKPTPDSEQF